MSISAMNWAWEQETDGPAMQIILVALADFADEEHSCWPSMAKLAARARISERTVKRVLRDLETAGYFVRRRRYVAFGKRSNDRYVLAVGQTITRASAALGAKLAPNEENEVKPQVTPLGANLAPNEENAPPLGANCGTYIENPTEKIDKSIFIEDEPSAEMATPPEENHSTSSINARLKKIHPSLSIAGITSRLKVADIVEVDVLRATQTLLSRATRTVHNPVAFVAKGIDRSPEVWRPMLPGFEPGQDVSGTISAREQRVSRQRAQAAACESGEHDWGPTVWAEVDRAHCLPCGTYRRSVDPVFRELQDEHDRYSNGRGESDGASA